MILGKTHEIRMLALLNLLLKLELIEKSTWVMTANSFSTGSNLEWAVIESNAALRRKLEQAFIGMTLWSGNG